MEIMCFDGKGWLAPTQGQRVAGSEKMPNNRLRQDINQLSLETKQHTERHTQSFLESAGASVLASKFSGNSMKKRDCSNTKVIRRESIKKLTEMCGGKKIILVEEVVREMLLHKSLVAQLDCRVFLFFFILSWTSNLRMIHSISADDMNH